MKQYVLPGLCFIGTAALLGIAYLNLDLPNQPRVHACTGTCYEEYVAANGNILDQQRIAAAEAASASPAELGRPLYAGCQACHGAGGEGGVGPQLNGRDQAFVVSALSAYKNRETRGSQSALMWPSASALSAADIENLGAFIESL